MTTVEERLAAAAKDKAENDALRRIGIVMEVQQKLHGYVTVENDANLQREIFKQLDIPFSEPVFKAEEPEESEDDA